MDFIVQVKLTINDFASLDKLDAKNIGHLLLTKYINTICQGYALPRLNAYQMRAVAQAFKQSQWWNDHASEIRKAWNKYKKANHVLQA